jgi:hypothetical protein
MLDCFISYSSHDEQRAKWVYEQLRLRGVSTFLAPLSVEPGEPWSRKIKENLKASGRVVFLASRAACASPYVNQEIGGAVCDHKPVVPVVWDMRPEELSGWATELQAIVLRNTSDTEWIAAMDTIAAQVKEMNRQRVGALALIALVVMAFWK